MTDRILGNSKKKLFESAFIRESTPRQHEVPYWIRFLMSKSYKRSYNGSLFIRCFASYAQAIAESSLKSF